MSDTHGELSPETRASLLERLADFTSDDDNTSPDELAKRFLHRRQYDRAVDPRVVILRGDRGAGKTALFRVITSPAASALTNAESWWEGYAGTSAHPSGDVIESLTASTPDDRLLRTFWLTHLAGRLLHHDPTLPAWVPAGYEQAPGDPSSWLADADAQLGRIQSCLDQCERALTDAGRTATVAYDHLDRIGLTNPAARVRSASALMAIWLSLSGRYAAIRGKLFLRNDLYDAGLSQSADASKLEARALDLAWSTQDLYRALLRRLGAEDALREWTLATLGDDSLVESGGAGWTPASPLPPEGSPSQKALADGLAGEIMGRGVKKGYTYRWIPNHLQDGHGRIVPRSLFNLVRFAADHALEASPRAVGRQLLHYTELQAALVKTSDRRVDELAEEYSVVKRVEALRGGMAPFSRSDALAKLDAGAGPGETRGEQLVDELIGIGVFTERKDRRLDLPDIYRYGLGVKRKGGSARPK